MSAHKADIMERFKCAGAMFVRGVTAPFTQPFVWAGYFIGGTLYSDMPPPLRKPIEDRELSDLLSSYVVTPIIVTVGSAAAFVAGLTAGTITFAESIIEAPYQIVRRGQPQSRPLIQRIL